MLRKYPQQSRINLATSVENADEPRRGAICTLRFAQVRGFRGCRDQGASAIPVPNRREHHRRHGPNNQGRRCGGTGSKRSKGSPGQHG